MASKGSQTIVLVPLAACRHTSFQIQTYTPCILLTTLLFANSPKRSMGHVLGAEKIKFVIRADDGISDHGGRAG
jgi:hypothetical protein